MSVSATKFESLPGYGLPADIARLEREVGHGDHSSPHQHKQEEKAEIAALAIRLWSRSRCVRGESIAISGGLRANRVHCIRRSCFRRFRHLRGMAEGCTSCAATVRERMGAVWGREVK